MGFIAQDVEKIFPEFVGDKEGIKMMNYTSFIPVLTKAMQELQAMIENLISQNAEVAINTDGSLPNNSAMQDNLLFQIY